MTLISKYFLHFYPQPNFNLKIKLILQQSQLLAQESSYVLYNVSHMIVLYVLYKVL